MSKNYLHLLSQNINDNNAIWQIPHGYIVENVHVHVVADGVVKQVNLPFIQDGEIVHVRFDNITFILGPELVVSIG